MERFTIAQYTGLPAIARGYLKITDDPRTAVAANWKTHSLQIQSDMTDYLAKAAPKIPDAKSHLDDLARRFAAFEAQACRHRPDFPHRKKSSDHRQGRRRCIHSAR